MKPFKVVKNHDRQRDERRRLMVDRKSNRYVQEWSDLDTGKVTYRKEGLLDDPEMHGGSARRST